VVKSQTHWQEGMPTEIYRRSLALRPTQGLMESIVKLLGIELPVPDYTTLCRGMRGLEVILPRKSNNEPIHIVVDSTGLKEFEWLFSKLDETLDEVYIPYYNPNTNRLNEER
jgi:hypothetical protein